MPKPIHQIFILLSCIAGLQAQELALSGYYENQFFPQELHGKLILQDYNKIRIDLAAEIGENVRFDGNYNYRIFHGKTRFNALDFIPESVVASFVSSLPVPIAIDQLRPFLDFKIEDENFLDNAFVTIYTERLNIRIGKQQLPWGSGYTWNPTDIFNEKNTLDPTYEKVGVNAFKLEAPLGKEGLLTGILGIGEDWRSSTKAVKLKQYFLGFDFAVSYVEKKQVVYDLDFVNQNFEKRRLVGWTFSGELFGLGVWGEGAYNFMQDTDDFGQYLIGADYTLENGMYFLGEFFRNGLGKTDKSRYGLADWLRLLSADGENLGRDYLFFGERYPIAELWNWANFAILNLNDMSGILFPWFDYSLNDNTELLFVGYVPFGTKETEFGEFGLGGFARIRVYF
jgi:hypothetical protein